MRVGKFIIVTLALSYNGAKQEMEKPGMQKQRGEKHATDCMHLREIM